MATPQSDACWRLKLMNMGFRVDLAESHHGDAAAWETGEDYQ